MAPWNWRHHYFASFHGTIPAATASSPRSGPPPRGRGPSLYCGIPNVSHTFTFLLRNSCTSATRASRCRVPRVLQPNCFCYSTTRGLSRARESRRVVSLYRRKLSFGDLLWTSLEVALQDWLGSLLPFCDTQRALLRRVAFSLFGVRNFYLALTFKNNLSGTKVDIIYMSIIV